MDDAPLWTPAYITQAARKILGGRVDDAEIILFEAWVEGVVRKPILSTCQSPLSLDGVSVVLSVPGLVYLVKILNDEATDEVAGEIVEYLRKICTNGVKERQQAVVDIDGDSAKNGAYIWMRRPQKPYRRNTARTKKQNYGRWQSNLK